MMVLAVAGEIVVVIGAVLAVPFVSRRVRCRARPAGTAPSSPAHGEGGAAPAPGTDPYAFDDGLMTGDPP